VPAREHASRAAPRMTDRCAGAQPRARARLS
jgi:hypothetical protein